MIKVTVRAAINEGEEFESSMKSLFGSTRNEGASNRELSRVSGIGNALASSLCSLSRNYKKAREFATVLQRKLDQLDLTDGAGGYNRDWFDKLWLHSLEEDPSGEEEGSSEDDSDEDESSDADDSSVSS